MGNLIKKFTQSFMVGVRETPKMYFAPISAMLKVVYHQAMDNEIEIKPKKCETPENNNAKKKKRAA